MKIRVCVAAVAVAAGGVNAQPASSNFLTYQGELKDAGVPANGTYDFRITMFDQPFGGSSVGLINCFDNQAVTDGKFTLTFHPGSVFDGRDLWMQIEVRADSTAANCVSGTFTTLSSRQHLTAAPVASSLVLPVNQSISSPAQSTFRIVNTATSGSCSAITGRVGSSFHGAGVWGDTFGNEQSYGVYGESLSSHPGSAGVSGLGTFSTGVLGITQSANGYGVKGTTDATALTGNSIAVYGLNASTGSTAAGVAGVISATSPGVFASGVEGAISSSTTSTGQGVHGIHQGSGVGVRGDSVSGIAVQGQGWTSGVTGYVTSSAIANTYGVHGTNANATGTGVKGEHSSNSGVEPGVWGTTNSLAANAVGVLGEVLPTSPSSFSAGVRGVNHGTLGLGVGLFGRHDGSGYGVYGETGNVAGYAGWFNGRVNITGALTKGSGAFKIDHPLDPENKFLYHSFVESPDMMNIYNGVVTTDDKGYATITMPGWFQALNQDFRYQLTVIDETDGDDFVLAKVVKGVADNRFTVRASKGGVKVSWQVTGIRHDAFARDQRIPTEEFKSESERGMFLYPQGFGFGEERQIGRLRPDQAVGEHN